MNSGLQCLMATRPLIHFLFEHLQEPVDCTLLGEFSRLVAKVWSGQFSVVHPQSFKSALGLRHPQFQDFRQVVYLNLCLMFIVLIIKCLHCYILHVLSQHLRNRHNCFKHHIIKSHKVIKAMKRQLTFNFH